MDNEPERQSGHASPVVRSSLEADLNRNLCLEDKLRRDDNEEPQELLKRLLSIDQVWYLHHLVVC